MNGGRRLEISEHADRDIDRHFNSIVSESLDAAVKFYDAMFQTFDDLLSMLGLEQRVDKLEQSIGTQAGLGCDRCRDFPYLPDVQNSQGYYYSHPPCRSCGRKFTYCVRIITESAAADVTSGDEPIKVHTFNFLRGAVIDEFTNES